MTGRLGASIIAMAVCVACGASPRPADVVVYASGTDLESANPLVTIHPLSRQVQRHVLFVTLIRYDSTLAPQPYFATSWTWSADRRDLTMRLVTDLKWHDGVRTTSRDVASTIRIARDPAIGYARASDLSVIDQVGTPTDSTLMLRFSSPQREVPAILAELPIIPAHLFDSIPRGSMRRAEFGVHPTGNGPFRFVERLAGQRWRFSRNEDFPATLGGPPRIRELVIAVVDEPTTKFAGLASGDLDFAGIAPTMASLAGRDPTMRVVDYPVLFSTGLVFNTQRAPFDDARVRRAFDLAVDRKRIVSAALAGYATPASGAVPPENPLASARSVAHDARIADSLFDAAGFTRAGSGARVGTSGKPLTVELLTVGSGDNAVEQLIQADLAERGVRVEIRQLELAAFLGRARASTKDFDLLITGVPGDITLSYVRAMFESSQRGGTLDYADFHSRPLDELFARARAARTTSDEHVAWAAVQEELARQAPVAWLYHSRGLQGVSARMRNVRMDLRGELATVSRWTTVSGVSALARR